MQRHAPERNEVLLRTMAPPHNMVALELALEQGINDATPWWLLAGWCAFTLGVALILLRDVYLGNIQE